MRQKRNARIERTMLGLEDHGIFTAFVYLDYGGAVQGFGGYALSGEYAYHFVSRVLDVVGERTWEGLVGRYVRADADLGAVYGIGNVLDDRPWFYPSEEFAEPQPEVAA